jgi:pilus assembly protein Flp/PilA
MIQAILFYIETLRSREERGQGMVEYALILALISVVAIVVLALIGTNIVDIFNQIAAKL